MSEITRVGADLAKRVIQIHGVDADGKPVFNLPMLRYLISVIVGVVFFAQLSIAQDGRRILWPALRGGPVIGGPYHGSVLPGKQGGMVVGGPLNGSAWPDSVGGMVVGGPLNGTAWPSAKGGMIVGGPLNGTVWPAATGGLIVGGPLNGYVVVPERATSAQ